MPRMSIDDIDVIAPNLKRRLSGVTASVFALIPVQALRIGIAATGPGLPADLPTVALWRVLLAPRNRPRVWHARRNLEMLVGVIARDILRRRLMLVFTSSSPRRRSAWTRWLVKRMDRVLATNPLNAAAMPVAAQVIPHGVDTGLFSPGRAAQNPRLIACVGRVRPRKGTAEFARAMCSLLPDRPGWQALIVGRVDDAAYAGAIGRTIAQARLDARVRFIDELALDRMPDFYRSLSVLVAPSLLEGFGLTPFEAAACGVPCVTSAGVGNFDELVIAGETGERAEPGDAEGLAAAIGRLMDDDDYRRRAGAAARARVAERFSIDAEAEALVAVYRDLLGNGPAR